MNRILKNFFLKKLINTLDEENKLISKKINYKYKKKNFTDPVTIFDKKIENPM